MTSGIPTHVAILRRASIARPLLNIDHLHRYRALLRGVIARHSQLLLARLERRSSRYDEVAIGTLFGTLDSSHPFRAPALDWGWRLTEPMVTRTLAHVLASGRPSVREARLRAFLKALGTPLCLDDYQLERAEVHAERNRIDLEILLPMRKEPSNRAAILVEAKFDHKVTPGQLRQYRTKILQRPGVTRERLDQVLLALRPRAKAGLYGSQVNTWRYRSWSDTWLSFMRNRPTEDRPDFAIFLQSVWSRIGGFRVEKK